MDSIKFFTYSAVSIFAFLFILIPVFILVLTSFTGEPMPILEYLYNLDFNSIADGFKDFSPAYYTELFETRRYRLSLINTLGLAPSVCALYAVCIYCISYSASVFNKSLALKVRRLADPAITASIFAVVLFVSVFWRFAVPKEMQAEFFMRWLAPGRTVYDRLLQGIGFCPAVTLFASALGTAAAWCIMKTLMPCRKLMRFLCVIPLALPSFLGALALKNLLGINGVLTKLLTNLHLPLPFEAQSAQAALFVQVFLYFPFAALTVCAVLEHSSPAFSDAAKVLSSRSILSFFKIHLPMLYPGAAAGAILIFIRSIGDFASLSLLMPMKYPVMIVEAYRDLSGSTYWGGACMLSSIALTAVLLALFLQKESMKSGAYETVSGRIQSFRNGISERKLSDWAAFAFCVLVFSVPVMFAATTFLVSIAGSWGIETLPSSYTLERYSDIFRSMNSAGSPVFNSFVLSLAGTAASAVLALIIVLMSEKGRICFKALDYLTMLPFVVPGTALAIALICAFNGPPLSLHLTAALVIIAYILTSTPYGIRSVSASLKQINKSFAENSQVLGADSLLTYAKVILPLIKPGLVSGMVLIFIACMQEVSVTLMTCPLEWRPASVYVFIEIQEGSVFNASACGILIFALILIPYALVFKHTQDNALR